MLEEQLRLIYKYTNIGFLACRPDGLITKCNEAASFIFKAPLIDENISSLLPAHIVSRHPDLMEKFIDSGERAKPMQRRSHIQANDADGLPISLRISLVKSKDAEGGLELIAIIEDVTDLVAVSNKLEVARSKKKFLRKVLIAQKTVGKYFQVAGLLGFASFVWFAVTTQVNFKFSSQGTEFDFTPRESSQVAKLIENVPSILAASGGALAFMAGKKREVEITKNHDDDDEDEDEDE